MLIVSCGGARGRGGCCGFRRSVMSLVGGQGSDIAVRLVIEDRWLDSNIHDVCCCESIPYVLSVDIRAGYLGRTHFRQHQLRA